MVSKKKGKRSSSKKIAHASPKKSAPKHKASLKKDVKKTLKKPVTKALVPVNDSVPSVIQLNVASPEPQKPQEVKIDPPTDIKTEVKEDKPQTAPSDTNTNQNQAKPDQEIRKPQLESEFLKIVGVVLCCMVVLFWLMVLIFSMQVHTGPYNVEKNITTIKKVSIPLSFESQLASQDVRLQVSLQGYLRKECVNSTAGRGIESCTNRNYMIDDTGKNITAVLKLSQMAEYDKLFSNNSKVKTTYNVTGVYRLSLGTYILEVSSITPYTRLLVEQSESKMENVTINDKRGITFNIAKGWTKISSLLN